MDNIKSEKQKIIKELQDNCESMLRLLSDMCLEIDAENLGPDIQFSDQAMVDSLIIFNSITSNRAIHNMQTNKVDFDFACTVAGDMGKQLRTLFEARTGVSLSKYFNNLSS